MTGRLDAGERVHPAKAGDWDAEAYAYCTRYVPAIIKAPEDGWNATASPSRPVSERAVATRRMTSCPVQYLVDAWLRSLEQ